MSSDNKTDNNKVSDVSVENSSNTPSANSLPHPDHKAWRALMFSAFSLLITGIVSTISHYIGVSADVNSFPTIWVVSMLFDILIVGSFIVSITSILDIVDKKRDILVEIHDWKYYPQLVIIMVSVVTLSVFILDVLLPFVSIIANK